MYMNELKVGSKQIHSINGTNYIKVNFYEDLIFNFPLSKKNKKKFSENDSFAKFSLQQDKILNSKFVDKKSHSDGKFIRLPRQGEIIEFTQPFTWAMRTTPSGIYTIENTQYSNSNNYDTLRCYIRNITTNQLREILFYGSSEMNYRNIYLYIPIIDKQNKIEECKKIISKNHTTKHIMHQLWENRERTGDYEFYKIKAHSNIIRLNSEFINSQLENYEQGLLLTNSHKCNFVPELNRSENRHIVYHTVSLVLYLLYFNNLAQYSGHINRDILEYSLLFCDYLGINNNIKRYINALLINCYN